MRQKVIFAFLLGLSFLISVFFAPWAPTSAVGFATSCTCHVGGCFDIYCGCGCNSVISPPTYQPIDYDVFNGGVYFDDSEPTETEKPKNTKTPKKEIEFDEPLVHDLDLSILTPWAVLSTMEFDLLKGDFDSLENAIVLNWNPVPNALEYVVVWAMCAVGDSQTAKAPPRGGVRSIDDIEEEYDYFEFYRKPERSEWPKLPGLPESSNMAVPSVTIDPRKMWEYVVDYAELHQGMLSQNYKSSFFLFVVEDRPDLKVLNKDDVYVAAPQPIDVAVDGSIYEFIYVAHCYHIAGHSYKDDGERDLDVPSLYNDFFVKGVGDSAFYQNRHLTSIKLPDTIESVAKHAFDSSRNIKTITMPKQIKRIGVYSFSSMEKLDRIVIPYGVTSIPANAFSRCEVLTSVSLPETLQKIEKGAFINCRKLITINLPKRLESVDATSFRNTAVTNMFAPYIP